MARKSKMIETAPAAQSMPDAATGGQEETETAKVKVAKHELLDDQGNVVENEEEANGSRYTLIANGQTFDYQYGKNPTADKMLAIFGAKTLCTNETSAMRNGPKGAASPDEQIEAVRERFALIDSGKWVDRTREGVGAKVDLDKLAEAICQTLVAEGKKSQEEVDSGYKAKVRQKLDDDKVWTRKVRTLPAVQTAYAALVGKPTATVDDLMI